MQFINPKKYIKQNNFNPSKKMGQNFLIDQTVLNEINECIRDNDADAIIEIGPGLGSLTIKLMDLHKPLHLIELDKRLYDYLNTRLKDYQDIEIINADVLRCDLDVIASKYSNCIIIANLPYSISTLLVIKFLKTQHIKEMYCMLQKEVVDRLDAKPQTHAYNAFSCLFQHMANCKRLVHVKPSCFEPSPQVDSLFIKITKKDNTTYDYEYDKFLKSLFLARRKTMFNNLKNLYQIDLINKMYQQFKLDKNIRSEVLPESLIFEIYQFMKKEE